MDYSALVKRIALPEDFKAPQELTFEDIIATPLKRADVDEDMAAVNSSLDIIRSTRGGSWPTQAVSREFNYLDLAWHEREFRDGNSFAYAVHNSADEYIGCFYLYGLGLRTPLDEQLLTFQVDASWWVTAGAYEQGYYPKLKAALDEWLPQNFGFNKVHYSNKLP